MRCFQRIGFFMIVMKSRFFQAQQDFYRLLHVRFGTVSSDKRTLFAGEFLTGQCNPKEVAR